MRKVFIRGVKIPRDVWGKLRSPVLWRVVDANSREETIEKVITAFVERYGKDVDVVFIAPEQPKPYGHELPPEEPEEPVVTEKPKEEEVEQEDVNELEDNFFGLFQKGEENNG